MDVTIEAMVVMSLLKLTRLGPVSHELIKKDANMPSSVITELLRKLQNDGFIYVENSNVRVDDLQRLRLATSAVQSGMAFDSVADLLHWREFESIAALSLERSGYAVSKNFHFTRLGKRWEIDLIGCKKPLTLCVDCKHWHRELRQSALEKIVAAQIERTCALAESWPIPRVKMECASWETVSFIPAVLSLIPSRLKFCDNVPIVPVLQLRDFLNELPANVSGLKQFWKKQAKFKAD